MKTFIFGELVKENKLVKMFEFLGILMLFGIINGIFTGLRDKHYKMNYFNKTFHNTWSTLKYGKKTTVTLKLNSITI